MKKININQIGKFFTFILIIWFMITDFLAKISYTATFDNDLAGSLRSLGYDIYHLSSSIVFAGCLIALAILFTNNKKSE